MSPGRVFAPILFVFLFGNAESLCGLHPHGRDVYNCSSCICEKVHMSDSKRSSATEGLTFEQVYCGEEVVTIPTGLPKSMRTLVIESTPMKYFGSNQLKNFPFLQEISVCNSAALRRIEADALRGMVDLETFEITTCPSLTEVEDGSFSHSPKIRRIKIVYSGITRVPDLTNVTANGNILEYLDLESNRIDAVRSYDFKYLKVGQLFLQFNDIRRIGRKSFYGATIDKLFLRDNPKLTSIHKSAFEGIVQINTLDLSHTAIHKLPPHHLHTLVHLILLDVKTLTRFPPVFHLDKLETARLTYSYHCCAFKCAQHQEMDLEEKMMMEKRLTAECDKNFYGARPTSAMRFPRSIANDDVALWAENVGNETTDSGDGLTDGLTDGFVDGFGYENEADDYGFFDFWGDFVTSATSKTTTTSTPASTKAGDGTFVSASFAPFNDSMIDVDCGRAYFDSFAVVECSPAANAFNPCEDIMTNNGFRIVMFLVAFFALLGNLFVFTVLLSSCSKMSVSKFLILNLGVADFMIGVYLTMISIVDMKTVGMYFNFAIDWQHGMGCQVAGFFSVFGSVLSIATLTFITAERWYAIQNAINLNKRIRIKFAMKTMLFVYAFSFVAAALPIFEVSSYGWTSTCLPMDTSTVAGLVYVISLLAFTVLCFSAIMFFYVTMFNTVREGGPTHKNDATVAKRMAVLVFTDFGCWFPIAFFGATAAAGYPLISVSQSKILLVFFYPLNSCANPFLYAVFTKQFKKDLYILLSRCGFCKEAAMRHKGVPMRPIARPPPARPLSDEKAGKGDDAKGQTSTTTKGSPVVTLTTGTWSASTSAATTPEMGVRRRSSLPETRSGQLTLERGGGVSKSFAFRGRRASRVTEP